MIAGIDPGFTGGIVIMDEDGFIHELEGMPVIKEGSKTISINVSLFRILLEKFDISHIYIEKVWGMPGQGGGRSFTFGEGYGMLRAIIEILEIPYTPVAAITWKSKLGLMTKGLKVKERKQQSIDRVNQLYPKEKVTKDGLADAILIARYGLGEGI